MEKLFNIEGEEDYQKGIIYLGGNSETPIDIRKAFEFFNKAAQFGHVEAMFQVGYLYLFGEPNIMRNDKKAIQCFEKAANAGLGIAQYYCGIGYFYGNGIEKDVNVGLDYLVNSAKQGYYLASDILAEIYLTGTGVEKDLKKAEQYNNKARVPGNQNAEIRFVRIMMEPKEI